MEIEPYVVPSRSESEPNRQLARARLEIDNWKSQPSNHFYPSFSVTQGRNGQLHYEDLMTERQAHEIASYRIDFPGHMLSRTAHLTVQQDQRLGEFLMAIGRSTASGTGGNTEVFNNVRFHHYLPQHQMGEVAFQGADGNLYGARYRTNAGDSSFTVAAFSIFQLQADGTPGNPLVELPRPGLTTLANMPLEVSGELFPTENDSDISAVMATSHALHNKLVATLNLPENRPRRNQYLSNLIDACVSEGVGQRKMQQWLCNALGPVKGAPAQDDLVARLNADPTLAPISKKVTNLQLCSYAHAVKDEPEASWMLMEEAEKVAKNHHHIAISLAEMPSRELCMTAVRSIGTNANALRNLDLDLHNAPGKALAENQTKDVFQMLGNVNRKHPQCKVTVNLSGHDLHSGVEFQDGRRVELPEDMQELSRLLKRNTTIKSLNLSGCRINDYGAKLLLEALDRNTSIVQLDLSLNRFKARYQRQIEEKIERNRQLNGV